MDEIWVSLTQLGFSKYEASSHGRIRNKIRESILAGSKTDDGYVRIKLYNDNGTHQNMMRSNLIAYIFCVKSSEQNNTVDHINRIRDDDRPINLRWVTWSEQAQNRSNTSSSSKYRSICQYDINGNYGKVSKTYKIF